MSVAVRPVASVVTDAGVDEIAGGVSDAQDAMVRTDAWNPFAALLVADEEHMVIDGDHNVNVADSPERTVAEGAARGLGPDAAAELNDRRVGTD